MREVMLHVGPLQYVPSGQSEQQPLRVRRDRRTPRRRHVGLGPHRHPAVALGALENLRLEGAGGWKERQRGRFFQSTYLPNYPFFLPLSLYLVKYRNAAFSK